MNNDNRQTDYDDEPVVFCSKCYSLKIKHDDSCGEDYCVDCGNTDMISAPIEQWEKLYEGRYGHKYVEHKFNPKTLPVFSFSTQKIKDIVRESPFFFKLYRELYPHAPYGMSKADSYMWLFDKISRDCRLDDLKICLWKYMRKCRKNQNQ